VRHSQLLHEFQVAVGIKAVLPGLQLQDRFAEGFTVPSACLGHLHLSNPIQSVYSLCGRCTLWEVGSAEPVMSSRKMANRDKISL